MGLSDIIIELIREMQLNETELEEIHDAIHEILRVNAEEKEEE